MWHSLPGLTRRLLGDGLLSGWLRPALIAGAPQAANANILLTRTKDARRMTAALPSIFERARFLIFGAGAGAWSEVDDHAHVDRRAPPGRNGRFHRNNFSGTGTATRLAIFPTGDMNNLNPDNPSRQAP